MNTSSTYAVLENGFAYDSKMRDDLRKAFPKEQTGKLPRTEKRPELDYVGHAAVTDRLNHCAPDWEYTVDEMFSLGGVCWVRGTMTIGGVSRPEYGDGKDPKEAIGNFIRRGAMRFGVALDLWSKEELTASGGSSSGESASAASPPVSQQGTPPEPTSEKTFAYGEGAAAPSAETDPGGQDAGSDTAPQGTVETVIDRVSPDPDALASKETWDYVLSKGVKASVALKIARKLWPDAGIRSSTELTNGQLGRVLVAYLDGERG